MDVTAFDKQPKHVRLDPTITNKLVGETSVKSDPNQTNNFGRPKQKHNKIITTILNE